MGYYLFTGLQFLDSTSFNSNFHMGAKFFQLQYLSLDVTMSDIEEAAPENRPFYSCGLSTLAFDWMWGWRWPGFDANPLSFFTESVLKKY